MAKFNDTNPLDVFMSNASITDYNGPNKSADGVYDLTLQVNVIACHILLKRLLRAAVPPKRICVTASGAHKMAKEKIDLANLNFENEEWTWTKSYCRSKLMEIMLCVGAFHKGLLPATTTLLCFCPGYIATKLGADFKAMAGSEGRDVESTDETFLFATSDKYVDAGGLPIYYKQKDRDDGRNP